MLNLVEREREREEDNDQPKLSSFITKPKEKKYASNNRRQNEITDALLMFIAGNLQPLSVVDNSDFHDLIALLDPKYTIPSRKQLTSKYLHQKSVDVHEQVLQ